MAGGSFLNLARVAAFFVCVWTGGKVSKTFIGVSPILSEIVVGCLLGPQLADLMPTSYSLCQEDPKAGHTDCSPGNPGGEQYEAVRQEGKCQNDQHTMDKFDNEEECMEKLCKKEWKNHCSEAPDIFTFAGQAGVAMMIFESGMHFDFEKVRAVGAKACVVAVIGTLLPLIAGFALSSAYGFEIMESLAVGVALAPTSVGIALKLLMETKQLDKEYGQAIITAAFVDDILSIIAYSVLFNVGDSGSFSFSKAVLPGLLGILILVFGSIIAKTVFPRVVPAALEYVKDNADVAKFHNRDNVLLIIVFITFLGYALLAHVLAGSALLGCFVAGMSFAMVHRAHFVWVQQTKRITTWLMRVFFACTVGFAIPVKNLASLEALWRGMFMGVGPCILTKVCCALFMGDTRWVIGWAMVGRAEFAYLIAGQAVASGLMSDDLFAIAIWSLLLATIVAPITFRFVLTAYKRKLESADLNAAVGTGEGQKGVKVYHRNSSKLSLDGTEWMPGASSFRVQIGAKFYAAIHRDVDQSIAAAGFEIIASDMHTDDEDFVGVYQLQYREKLTMDGMVDLQRMLLGTFKSKESHIIFLPELFSENKTQTLRMRVMGHVDHESSESLRQVLKILEDHFVVLQASVELHKRAYIMHFFLVFRDEMQTLSERDIFGPSLSATRVHERHPIIAKVKEGIKEAFGTANIAIQPIVHDQGPLGETAHDPRTLAIEASEIRQIHVFRVHNEEPLPQLMMHVLDVIIRFGLQIISTRCDGRTTGLYMLYVSMQEKGDPVDISALGAELKKVIRSNTAKGSYQFHPVEFAGQEEGIESQGSSLYAKGLQMREEFKKTRGMTDFGFDTRQRVNQTISGASAEEGHPAAASSSLSEHDSVVAI